MSSASGSGSGGVQQQFGSNQHGHNGGTGANGNTGHAHPNRHPFGAGAGLGMPSTGSSFFPTFPPNANTNANANTNSNSGAAPAFHTADAATDAALVELSRLSPEDLATVLSFAGIDGGMDMEALLGLDLSAFNGAGVGAEGALMAGFGAGTGPAVQAEANTNAPAGAKPPTTTPATATTTAGTSTAPPAAPAPAPASASARPDLVRLADLVTHASLMLNQPTDGPRKYTRSRRGCLTCRARKVKCDEVRPKCLRCAAMGRECAWDEEKADRGKKPRKKAAAAAGATAGATTGGTATATAAAPATAAADAPSNTAPAAGSSEAARRSCIPAAAPAPIPGTKAAPVPSRAPTSVSPTTSTFPPSLPSSLPNLSFPQSSVPPIPAGAPAPVTPSADALAAAGLPASLAKALAELAHPRSETESPFDSGSGQWAPFGRRQSEPTPRQSHQQQQFPPLPAFKPTPPSSGPDEPNPKRFRANDAAPSELVGLPFDFQAWVTNVGMGSGSPSSPSQSLRKSSDAEQVIELARSALDAQGRIKLEPAEAMVVDEEYAQMGDINLSLKGKLARRRLSDFNESENAEAEGSRSAAGAAPTASASTSASRSSTRESILLPTSVSNLIKLASQPSRELDPFMHAFPTASTRGLFQHYVDCTAGIVTAMGRSKPRENPFLQVSLPLVVGDTTSPGIAALRFSLLTTSAAHIFHLRGGTDAADMCDRLKKLAIGYTVILQSEIEKERTAAAVAARERSGPSRALVISHKAERDNDLVLAACVVLVTRDVLSADPTWKANLEFALASIRRRGGPETLMAADPSSFMRRFVLEQLATHEVFSCFTTGSEPTLLLPHAKWWFDVEKSSTSNWEWESVENQFGISRMMVEVVCRICALCARKNRLGPTASLDLDDPDFAPVAAHLRSEAEALIAELDQVAVELRSLPLQRRVQYGDHIYRLTMSLHLMTEILCLPATHARIRAIVPAALELCSEISSQPVMLVWPLLLVARVATPKEREWVQSLARSYSEQYCRDLQIAEELITEMWKRQDAGTPMPSWHWLMAELDREVLLI